MVADARVTAGAFLRPECVECVKKSLAEKIILAASWSEFERLIAQGGVTFGLVDLAADGLSIPEVAGLIRQQRHVPLAAYVDMRPQNLSAVFYLSKLGLRDVFVHPMIDNGSRLRAFARRMDSDALSVGFISMFETRIALIGMRLGAALYDLFERPQRYERALDIALASGLHPKSVYRAFRSAGLGPPKRFVIAAKLLKAYAYLRESSSCVDSVSKELRYSRSGLLSEQISGILGCSPEQLRREANSSEVVAQILEWLFKPTHHVAQGGRACETQLVL